MKTLTFFSFLLIQTIVFGQQAGIYNINFRIEPELVNGNGIPVPTNGQPPNQNSWFYFNFPKNIRDSIIVAIERQVSKELNMPASCVYRLNRRDKPITSTTLNNQLGGMPNSSLRWAIRNVERDLYVRVNVQIVARGGSNFTFFEGTISRLRPMVIIRIHAHNTEKRSYFKKTVREKDFSSLRTFRRQVGPFSAVGGDVLQAQDVYLMTLKTLEKFQPKLD
jgi:hypothetical protein